MKIRRTLLCLISAVLLALTLLPCTVSAAGEDEKPVIIIDPGHGGMDGGTTAGIRYEKTYNLIISQYLRDILTEHGGFEVYMTREDDSTDIKFLPRALYIVEHDADLLLSLHCNSSEVAYASGVLAITSVIEPYSAFDLGGDILARISEKTGLKNRGVETRHDTGDSLGVYYWNSEKQWDMPGASYLKTVSDYFSMNTWSSKFGVPSLIVEHGYLSNSTDREIIVKDENLRKFAEAEAEALIEYYYGHTHTFPAEKTVDFPSSCSLTGTKSYRCTVCGLKAETEPLPAAPDAHFYRQSASMRATCGKDGFIEYTCQISHNLNDKGYPTTVHSYTDVLPMKEHAYRVTEDIAAGHGVDGRHTEYCDNCGDTVTTTTPGEPHTYEKSGETAPSCTEKGSITYKCTGCDLTYSEEIPETGHSPDGNGVCTVCGSGSETAETAAETETQADETQADPSSETASDAEHEHLYFETARTEPTCTADGTVVSVCDSCGDEKTEVIPAIGHDLITSMDTPASCEKEGFYRARCMRCREEITEKHPALGHRYEVESESKDEIVKICRRCGSRITETVTRRNPLTSPLIIGVCVIVALQAVLLGVMAVHRKKTHKPLKPGDNDMEDDGIGDITEEAVEEESGIEEKGSDISEESDTEGKNNDTEEDSME